MSRENWITVYDVMSASPGALRLKDRRTGGRTWSCSDHLGRDKNDSPHYTETLSPWTELSLGSLLFHKSETEQFFFSDSKPTNIKTHLLIELLLFGEI